MSGKKKHTANKFAVLDREMCLSKLQKKFYEVIENQNIFAEK